MKKNYCLFMAMLIMSLTNAFGQTENWDGSISSSLAKDGDVYLIQSGSDLAFLAQEVNKANTNYVTASYKLTTDIDLNNKNWIPIGNNGKAFSGIFDGNNHTVSNLSINTTLDQTGFFGNVTSATVKNLYIETAKVSGYNKTGTLIGASSGSTIQNCSVKNSTIEMAAGKGKYGVVVGDIWNGTFTNCYAISSTINNNIQPMGGFVGNIAGGQGTILTNCFTKNITFKNTTPNPSQGLFFGAANTAHKTTLKNCYCESYESYPYIGTTPYSNLTITENGSNTTPESMIKSAIDFANPKISWSLNTNGITINTATWSHNGEYPIFADTNNMPVYKAGTIYNNSMVGEQCYTSGVLPENFTAIDLRTNTETIPNADLATLLNKGCKNILVYSGSTINNYTGNVITGNNPSISLTDGAPFHCPIEITNANVTYTRNFLDGWNTICLPFGFTTTAEDEDKVEELVSGTAESVSFEYVTDGTVANTPYLINIKSAGAKTFNATNITIPTSASLSDVTADSYTFKGTMTTSILTEGYGLVLDNATQEVMFKKIPETGSEITPFRAYLTSTAAPANAPLKVIHGDGGATNVNSATSENIFQVYAGDGCINIVVGKAQIVKVLGIDGHLIKTVQLNEGSNTINGINKGIYLINNQKVLVK